MRMRTGFPFCVAGLNRGRVFTTLADAGDCQRLEESRVGCWILAFFLSLQGAQAIFTAGGTYI